MRKGVERAIVEAKREIVSAVPGYVKDEKFGLGEFEKKEENLESKLVCDENREREEFGLRMSE